jgi:hypothetical protein
MNRFFFHFEKCFTKRLGLIRLYYFGIVLKVQQDEISKVRLGFYRTLLKNRNSENAAMAKFHTIAIAFKIVTEYRYSYLSRNLL